MPEAQPRFFVLSGPDLGRSFDLREGATFGRSADCEAPLRAPSISRRHARLERAGAGWAVVDLGSRNGMSRDGERVERIALADGLVFKLGDVELRVRLEERAAPSASVEPAQAPVEPPRRVPVSAADTDLDVDVDFDPDEIVLEEVDEHPASPPSRTPAAANSSAPAPPRPTTPPPRTPRTSRAPEPPAAPPSRGPLRGSVELRDAGRPILQYKAIPARGGFALSDLAQQPLGIKLLVGLLVVGLFVAIFLVAFRGTQFVRGKVGGEPAVEVEEQ